MKKNMRMLKQLLFSLLFALLLGASARADVLINEVMASTAIFANGRSDDWVELYNSGSAPVSLKGWYLSDDPYSLTRWAFPKEARIDAKGYLVVYCAGETVTNGSKNALYATFKLSAKGDAVYLTSPEGATVCAAFGPQHGNISSGVPLGGEGWHYLETATPGKPNDSRFYDLRASAPALETAPGFYEGGVSVSLRAEEGLEIRYTTDCSEPSRTSPLYSEPISVSKTTVIRARCFAEDMLGSSSMGGTYFIDDPTPIPLPVMSIYTDEEYLFSARKGILVKGSGEKPNYEYNWEYPLQIEYFDEGGQQAICQMGTVRVSGNTTRFGKQKSLSIYARAAYGSSTFAYPFFEDRDYTEYPCLLLRCANTDARITRMRDAVLTQLSEGLNVAYAAARPILVYINGQYYGHYNLREKSNKDALAQWEGITDSKVIDGCTILEFTGMERVYVVRGDNRDWVDLMRFCRRQNLNDPENLQYVLDRLDVDTLFDYAIYSSLIGNYDTGNVRIYRFPGGKWKFMLHDVESGVSNDNINPVNVFLRRQAEDSKTFPHWPLAALMQVPEYRERFLARIASITENNFLYASHVKPRFELWYSTLLPLMPRHNEAFQHFSSLKSWEKYVNRSMHYARVRPALVIDAFCRWLKVTDAEKQQYFAHTLELLKAENAAD